MGSVCPDLTLDSAGRAWLSWIEPAGEGRHALKIARFEGAAFDEPRQVVSGEDWFVNWADFPTLAANQEDVLLASWLVRSDDQGAHYDAFVARSPDGGEAFGQGQRLHDDLTNAEHGFVSLAPLPEGRFAAVWLDGRDMLAGGHGSAGKGATALRFANVDAQGKPQSEQVLDARVCDCCQTAMVRRADGELIVAYRDRSEDELRDIFFVRGRAEDPQSWSAPEPVHIDGWEIAGCPVNGPALATDGERVAVSWFTLGADRKARVMLALLEPGADTFSTPVRIDEGSPEGRCDVAFVDGEVYVSWLERAGSLGEWRLRRVKGSELAPSLLVAQVPMNRASGFLRCVPLGEGLLLAWTEPEGVRVVLSLPTGD